MQRLVNNLNNNLEEVLCVTFTVIFVSVSLMQIVVRHSGLTVPWTEEVARYLFIWTIFMGIPWGVKSRAHLNIDAIYNLFPPKYRSIHGIITHLLIIAFACPLIYYSLDVVLKQYKLGQALTGLPMIPMWVVYLCMPISFTLVIVRCIQIIVIDMFKLNNEQVKESEV